MASDRSGAIHEDALPLTPKRSYALVRFCILRLLGFVYLVAFASALQQIRALVGEHGLLPATDFFDRVARISGGKFSGFLEIPSLFWITGISDPALVLVCVLGVALSLALLCGATNAFVQLGLWILYMSLLATGQTFYSFGWELQLVETGLLTVFMCPWLTIRPFSSEPPFISIVLSRWLIVRVMLGAGFIKLRGDECWRDFTCLYFHYETQPNPNPFSVLFHSMPHVALRIEVLVNFIVECALPFFAFGPRTLRIIAGIGFIAFQLTLIASGNLSFLNWLTMVPAIACFDDDAILRVIPRRFRDRVGARSKEATAPSKPSNIVAIFYAVVVGFLSITVVVNFLSSHQAMNASFEPLHIVNTYGAFGSVSRERFEIVIEGTSDSSPEDAHWVAYEFPCKPGDPMRRPCLVSPWHYRLDWQMWFAAMADYEEEPWLVELVAKMLRGDRSIEPLLANDPFPDAPPKWVRAEIYKYELAPMGDRAYWRRSAPREYLRPMSKDDPDLRAFLDAHDLR